MKTKYCYQACIEELKIKYSSLYDETAKDPNSTLSDDAALAIAVLQELEQLHDNCEDCTKPVEYKGISEWKNTGIRYGYDKYFNINWPK